jgi:hypothetical protein
VILLFSFSKSFYLLLNPTRAIHADTQSSHVIPSFSTQPGPAFHTSQPPFSLSPHVYQCVNNLSYMPIQPSPYSHIS